MFKRISFILLSDSSNRAKQFSVPLALIGLLTLMTILGVTLLGYLLYHNHGLRQNLQDNGLMAQSVAQQREEIASQRRQIQSFAHEINALKDQLVKLNQFEERIRVIANLEPDDGAETLLGVGGPASEDLDPQLELTKRHESLLREMHRQVDALRTATTRQHSNFGTMLEELEDRRSLLASTPAIRPTSGWLTSRFGYRTSPFTGSKEFHKGIDIANRKGNAILATADGVISYEGKKGQLGKVMVIDHGHGMITRYAHLQETLKKKGAKVKRGDIIAEMGNTGRSTGSHLHYEVHLNGVPVNPADYILN